MARKIRDDGKKGMRRDMLGVIPFFPAPYSKLHVRKAMMNKKE
jgi:hypothetical protein